jgi:hypothetical protein
MSNSKSRRERRREKERARSVKAAEPIAEPAATRFADISLPENPVAATTKTPKSTRFANWTGGDFCGLIGGIVGFASAIFAGFSWWEAHVSRIAAQEGTAVSKLVYERGSGRIKAGLSFVGFRPTLDKIPAVLRLNSLQFPDTVRITKLNQLRSLDLHVTVENTGTEIIEALQLEIRVTNVGIHDPNRPGKDTVGIARPWALTQPEQEQFVLTHKLHPAQKADIPLAKGILLQMMRSSSDKFVENEHYGAFDIRCYGRIVGGSSFDEMKPEMALLLLFAWTPKALQNEETKKFLADYRPAVELEVQPVKVDK